LSDGFDALIARARSEQGRSQHAQAEATLRQALAIRPGDDEATFGLGLSLLGQGRYAEGWPLLEPRARLSPGLIPSGPGSCPEWRGEALAGKSILVMSEQGFGDQIMLVRFAKRLREQGARVTLACQAALARLFEPLADAVVPIVPGESVAVAPHDYWTRYFSLPQHLGATLETLPAEPYLAALDDVPPPAGRIGLAWAASSTGPLAAQKSLPKEAADYFLRRGFVSLQPEDTGARDFADTAAIIDKLDLVISIDTAVAHLAGAMGKPVRVLLPHAADWRWMNGREDSPWYPSAKLMRQASPGDWISVLGPIREAVISGKLRVR
jgi:tetratricopeptide (TPR) repeat protein